MIKLLKLIKRDFRYSVILGAMYHNQIAIDIASLKRNNILFYGEEYSKTLEYALLEFEHEVHILIYNFYKTFIN